MRFTSSRSAPSSVSPLRCSPRCSSPPFTSSSTGCGTTFPNVSTRPAHPGISCSGCRPPARASSCWRARSSRATAATGRSAESACEPTPLSHAPGIALAALGTLAFGAVLGPEAPLIALGSVVGVAVASLARADSRDGKVLSTAGSFSAISSIFGGPLVAAMLLLEAGVGLGVAVIPFLIPGLVAASLGYLIFVGLGDWGGIEAAALSVPGFLPTRECISATS